MMLLRSVGSYVGAWSLAILAVMAMSIDRVPPGTGLKYLANHIKKLHTLLVFQRDPQPHSSS
jgi:hypothetical protein